MKHGRRAFLFGGSAAIGAARTPSWARWIGEITLANQKWIVPHSQVMYVGVLFFATHTEQLALAGGS